MAQEHNIRDIKDTYRPNRPNSDWAYLKKISPAIPSIKAVASHVETESGAISRGKKHKSPDATADIQILERSYQESNIHVKTAERVFNDEKVRKDLLIEGMKDIQTKKILEKWHENRNYKRSHTELWDVAEDNNVAMQLELEQEEDIGATNEEAESNTIEVDDEGQ